MLGGLWEFPGGKKKKSEPIEETITREIREETGLSVNLVKPYCKIDHAYTHFKITLHAYECHYVSGEATAKSSDEIRWVLFDELHTYPFPKANIHVIQSIRETKELPLLQNIK